MDTEFTLATMRHASLPGLRDDASLGVTTCAETGRRGRPSRARAPHRPAEAIGDVYRGEDATMQARDEPDSPEPERRGRGGLRSARAITEWNVWNVRVGKGSLLATF